MIDIGYSQIDRVKFVPDCDRNLINAALICPDYRPLEDTGRGKKFRGTRFIQYRIRYYVPRICINIFANPLVIWRAIFGIFIRQGEYWHNVSNLGTRAVI